MADSDELVSQFLAFTGSADTDRAASYLEMSGGDLETAVGLYMEHQGGGGGGAGSATAASSGGGGGMMGGGDEVRAPDATQSSRLIDDSFGGGMGMMGAMMGSHLPPYMRMDPTLEAQLASSAFASSGNNDDGDDDDNMESGGEEKDDGEQGSSSRKNSNAGLADMFAPPHHLLFKEGGFEGAREMAKSNRRWLLVNLQRDSEFACHALNRDVWRDELAENLIREGFVFWQDVGRGYRCLDIVCWNGGRIELSQKEICRIELTLLCKNLTHQFEHFFSFLETTVCAFTYRWISHPRVKFILNVTMYMTTHMSLS